MAIFNGKIVSELPPTNEAISGEYVQLVITDGEGHSVVTEYRFIGGKWSAIRTSSVGESIGQLYQSSILGLEEALNSKQNINTLTKSSVGLNNVDNVKQARIINHQEIGKLLVSGGFPEEIVETEINYNSVLLEADIGVRLPVLENNKILVENLPYSQIINSFTVPNYSDLEGIAGVSQGDIVHVINNKKSYIYSNNEYHQFQYPVSSVNGEAGDVVITKESLQLNNVSNFAQVKKAGSSAPNHLVLWNNTGGDEVKNSDVDVNTILTASMVDVSVAGLDNGKIKSANIPDNVSLITNGLIPDSQIGESFVRKVGGYIQDSDINSNIPRLVGNVLPNNKLSLDIPRKVNGKISDTDLDASVARLENSLLKDVNIPGNIPRLDQTGKLAANNIPVGTIYSTYNASSEQAMFALGAIPKHSLCFRSDVNKVYLSLNTNPVNSSGWRLLSNYDDKTIATISQIYLDSANNYVTSSVLNLFFDDFFTLDINDYPTVNPTLTYFFSRGIPLSSRFTANYNGDFKKVLRKSNGSAYLSNKIDLDYSSSGICKGLFMEQSDFNYLKGSYDFNQNYWIKDNGAVTVQAANGPTSFLDGSATNAFTVQTDGIFNSIYQIKSLNDKSRSFSIFLKRTNNRYALLHLFDNDNTSTFLKVYVDLVEGVTTVLSDGIGNSSNLVSHVETIDKFDNRWFRVSIDIVEENVLIDTYAIKLTNGLSESTFPLSGSSVLLANASLSQNGTKTIIPNLDQSQTNNYNFSFNTTDLDFINTNEGCFIFEFIFYNIALRNFNSLDQTIFFIGDTNDNISLYYKEDVNSLVLSTSNNSVTSSAIKSLSNISKDNDSIIRVAINYRREDSNTEGLEGLLEISVNGHSTISNSNVPTLVDFNGKTMSLCNKTSNDFFSGWLREIVYYPKVQSSLNLLSKVS